MDESSEASGERELNRADFLRRAGVGGALLTLGPLLEPLGASATAAAAARPDISRIASYLGPIDKRYSGKGLKMNMGIVVALSGPGSFYGDLESKGAILGMRHVKALGGPDFRAVIKDNRSGDPTASANAAKELGLAKTPLCLASYVGGFGAMMPSIKQYEMLTLDGGGGTSVFMQEQPYFYGSRAVTPNDTYAGVVKYISRRMPGVKRITAVASDYGAYINGIIESETRKQFAGAGFEITGYETVPPNATDFSSVIQKLRSAKPDLVLLSVLFGLDLAFFLKQYAASGIGKPTIGFDYTKEGAKVAGDAMNGYMFSYDFWNPANPPNGWGKIFAQAYRQAFKPEPDYLSANYYEDVFIFWDLVRRVLKAGDNPRSGSALKAAFEARPVFKSLYGGRAGRAGLIRFDRKTHSVAGRPLGLFRYRNGRVSTLATFGLRGYGYREV